MNILHPEQQCGDRQQDSVRHPFVLSTYESRNEVLANFLGIVHAAHVRNRLALPSAV